MAVKVTSKKVLSDRVPTQAETDVGVEYLRKGQLTASDLVDRRIEDKRLRERLKEDEGNISITVLPGERLGELSINVQFEGKSGAHEICLQEQDDLLQHTAEWLSEILSDFGCDFEAEIEALPCPHAEARLRIDLAAKRLAGEVVIEIPPRFPGPENKRAHHRGR